MSAAGVSSWRKLPERMMQTGIVAGLLLTNSVRDLQKKEILLVPTLLVWAGGVLYGCLAGEGVGIWWLPAMLPGAGLLLLSLATGGKVGFGDGLVVCAAGVWCGMGSVLFSLIAALVLVPVVAVLLRARGRIVREVPFVPFLLGGFLLEQVVFLLSAAGR